MRSAPTTLARREGGSPASEPVDRLARSKEADGAIYGRGDHYILLPISIQKAGIPVVYLTYFSMIAAGLASSSFHVPVLRSGIHLSIIFRKG
jgi:hypothetical protein